MDLDPRKGNDIGRPWIDKAPNKEFDHCNDDYVVALEYGGKRAFRAALLVVAEEMKIKGKNS